MQPALSRQRTWPQFRKQGESLIKVKASGICGSDMHAFHGNDERRIPPLILGHEVSGTSLDGKFKNKDVVINPYNSHGGVVSTYNPVVELELCCNYPATHL